MATGNVLLVFVLILHCFGISTARTRPNIVFILADDLGWHDVGFHGSEIATPNIDRLARDGIILNNYYVQPICTPTRAALLTGRYPMHSGLQHGLIGNSAPYGLPLNIPTLPEMLKKLGYDTHMIGKWHLGFYRKEYTPTYRGFDSHFGYWSGFEDYFDHTVDTGTYKGLDFRHNMDIVRDKNGSYSTDLFTEKAEHLIKAHKKTKPLFLYLAHQAVHSGIKGVAPLEAPHSYVSRFSHIKDHKRRTFAGMTAALDDSVGKVEQALKEANMLDNTIIIFSTDNGGASNGVGENAACNYPLRGTKFTLWEGGVRGAGFMYSPLLHKSNYISNHMMHVTDWMPTLYHVAGGEVNDLHNIDGVNQWETLSTNGHDVRTEMIHNIDPIGKSSSMRQGDYKIITGNVGHKNNGWYDCTPPESAHHNHNKRHVNETEEFRNDERRFLISELEKVKVDCGQKPSNAETACDPHKKPCLFNIREDPCEYHNIAGSHHHVVEVLMKKLDHYGKGAFAPLNKPDDPHSDPALHGGVWSPWVD